MKYSLSFRAQAAKRLAKLDEPYFSAIKHDTESLQEHYFPQGKKCKKLHGELKDLYRIRIGSYRALYHADHKKKIITVLRIFSREEGY